MFKKNGAEAKKTKLDQLPIKTNIASGITIVGDISGDSSIRVDGKVEGNINATKGIVLGEKAEVKGSLKSNVIIVHGLLKGDLNCKELHVKSTGVINGNITVNTIEIEMGGKYNGTLTMETAMPPNNNQKK